MREIALHILDIAENSVAARASQVSIAVCEDLAHDRLRIAIQDNGVGMDAETAAKVVDPFVTSRTTRKVGLGIPLLKAAAEACEGGLWIESQPGKGATVWVEFQLSHIDRMPLGDLPGTLLTLVVAYPEIRWIFEYQAVLPDGQEQTFEFDTQPVSQALEGIPFSEPFVLAYLRQHLEAGVTGIQEMTGKALPA